MNADALNTALEDAEQSILRTAAKRSTRNGGPAHFFSESDTFDKVPGHGLVVRRNNHVTALRAPEPGEYGG